MLSLRLAWRNIWRNRKRTAITLLAVALNTAILIVSLGLMQGMRRQMIRSATRLLVGDGQLHAAGYRADRSMYAALPDPSALVAQARRAGLQAVQRSYGFGLISSGKKSAGGSFWGVRPSPEREAFELADEVATGTWLSDTAGGGAVIGRKLARSLHAEVGTELVAVVQAADGSLGSELLRVVGILRGVGEEVDRGAVILHAADFDRLFVAGGRVHEVALSGAAEGAELSTTLGPVPPGVELRSWRELLPALSDMVNLSNAGVTIFALIFFLAAGLGVLNTMLMATHDRIREFGVLKALGASPARIVRDISVEGLLLAMVATGVGLIPGLAGAAWFQAYGLDLRIFGDASFGFAGIAWDPVWRAYVVPGDVLFAVVSMWVVCLAASLYPALRAARLDPVQAIHHV